MSELNNENIQKLKAEIITELSNQKKDKSDNKIIDILSKLAPLGTLIFLIFSYFHSIKPVFDKYEELKSKNNQIEILTNQINLKQTDLKDFTNKNNELKRENKMLEEKINTQSEIVSQYFKKIAETENLLNKEQIEHRKAENSAIIVHLKKFITDIFPYEYRNNKTSQYDIRKYVLNYAEKEKENYENDEYGLKAIEILKKYTKYKSSYGIDNSIYFLTTYYQLEYINKNK